MKYVLNLYTKFKETLKTILNCCTKFLKIIKFILYLVIGYYFPPIIDALGQILAVTLKGQIGSSI